MPLEAKLREEDFVKTSKISSLVKETVVEYPDVNFFEEPIIPKEEPIDFDNIPVPVFLVKETVKRKPKGKIKARKLVNAPKPPKEPENKDDYLYITNIEEFSDLDLQLEDIHEVRAIDQTSRIPERLVHAIYGLS